MSKSKREFLGEKRIICCVFITFVLVLISSYQLSKTGFKSNDFLLHLFALSSIMVGFQWLSYLTFSSLITANDRLFFLEEYSFFIPLFLILLIFYFILIIIYPFIYALLGFSFLGKVGLYMASFLIGAFIMGLFISRY